jgi:hypothetical protein
MYLKVNAPFLDIGASVDISARWSSDHLAGSLYRRPGRACFDSRRMIGPAFPVECAPSASISGSPR